VLASRNEDALDEAAAECRSHGVHVVAVPTDTSSEHQMINLADHAFDTFGRLDIWVNNASVGLFAKVAELPTAELERLFQINVFGYVNGAKAALPVFEVLGHGTLINVGSMVSKVPEPYTAAYTMSKHAVRALGGVLRQELALEHRRHIHVCTVMPATIDTPFFDHAANYTGRRVKAMPPVYSPERVARTIVHCARNPRREVYVGNAARLLGYQYKIAPRMVEWVAPTGRQDPPVDHRSRAVHRRHPLQPGEPGRGHPRWLARTPQHRDAVGGGSGVHGGRRGVGPPESPAAPRDLARVALGLRARHVAVRRRSVGHDAPQRALTAAPALSRPRGAPAPGVHRDRPR